MKEIKIVENKVHIKTFDCYSFESNKYHLTFIHQHNASKNPLHNSSLTLVSKTNTKMMVTHQLEMANGHFFGRPTHFLCDICATSCMSHTKTYKKNCSDVRYSVRLPPLTPTGKSEYIIVIKSI